MVNFYSFLKNKHDSLIVPLGRSEAISGNISSSYIGSEIASSQPALLAMTEDDFDGNFRKWEFDRSR